MQAQLSTEALLARQPGVADMEGRVAIEGELVVTAFWRR